jgi:hypothetical protein
VFDFLGYRFTIESLRLLCLTIQRFQANLARLYERGASCQPPIGQYSNNWKRWACSGGVIFHTVLQNFDLPELV